MTPHCHCDLDIPFSYGCQNKLLSKEARVSDDASVAAHFIHLLYLPIVTFICI